MYLRNENKDAKIIFTGTNDSNYGISMFHIYCRKNEEELHLYSSCNLVISKKNLGLIFERINS